MITHYGEVVIGAGMDMANKKSLEGLRRYLTESPNQPPLQELVQFWKILLEFKSGDFQKSSSLDNLIKSTDNLSVTNASQFRELVNKYTDIDNWQKVATPEGVEIVRIVKKLI